jgi:hypothetical protein
MKKPKPRDGHYLDDGVIQPGPLMDEVNEALRARLGYQPDVVLVLRAPDRQCRTFFSAGPITLAAEPDLRGAMTELLLSAVGQNDLINQAVGRGPRLNG